MPMSGIPPSMQLLKITYLGFVEFRHPQLLEDYSYVVVTNKI